MGGRRWEVGDFGYIYHFSPFISNFHKGFMEVIMDLKLPFTILVSKMIMKACRLVKLGGTTLPGEIALKIYPDIAKAITKNFRVIMVTGTNGKTTTTRIIGQILKENSINYITNKSGANLVNGVISTFIDWVDITGRCHCKTALLEVDEAAFNKMSDFLEPDILVVTNFFRDQLDRYGELYTTLKGVASGIHKSARMKLILNADDSLCASLGRGTKKKVIYYGFGEKAYCSSEQAVNSDAMFCIYCKTRYKYSNHVYGHLGGFECPKCGYRRPVSHITCTKVKELTSTHSRIEFTVSSLPFDNKKGKPVKVSKARIKMKINGCKKFYRQKRWRVKQYYTARVNLPGLYNIYNSLAALSCGFAMKLPVKNSIKALNNFECGFGRMETINTSGKTIKVILVKNPTGFNQVLNYILTEKNNIQLAFLINDRIADGTDVSWLWDVDFEKLQDMQERIDNIYASGIRAEDMAVRLKYAGIFTNKINIVKDYERLVNIGLSKTAEGGSFYILPTYTAMFDIRKILKKKFNLKEFWK